MKIYTWDQALTSQESNDALYSVSKILTSRISNEDVRTNLQRFLAGDGYRALIGLDSFVPSLSASDLICYRQVLAFFSKRQDLDLGVDRKSVALEKFLQSERECFVTNQAFKSYAKGGFRFHPNVDRVLHTASRKIAQILGDVPDLDSLRMRFGPGATVGLKKKNANALAKLRMPFACSEDLAPYVQDVLEEVPSWTFRDTPEDQDSDWHNILIQDGVVSFVPKNAKTDRTIVVEPLLNSFVQAGIGDYLVRRLKRFGIDLRDQSRNQALARHGSIFDDLATVDLSSASDTIATGLVEHLLPLDWFIFLSRYRTGVVNAPGVGKLRLEKFSSMGNGFTFPLESLIFYAITYACVVYTSDNDAAHDLVSVYGDDIICPSPAVPLLYESLRACGFAVNTAKSYTQGPFRESCGKDYLSGILCRPVYQKQRLTGYDVFRLHNFFVRDLDIEVAGYFLSLLDPTLHIWGPDGYGDGHLIGDYTPRPYKRDRQWAGYTFETFTWQSRSIRAILQPGDFPFPLYCTYLSDGDGIEVAQTKDGIRIPLPGTRGYKRIRIYTLAP